MPVSADTTRILMLHRVLADEPTAFGLPGCYRLRGTALTPSEFVDLLDQNESIVPLDAVERALTLDEPPPSGRVLTFDDGYREHLDLVAPMLRERGLTATFYIPTGMHGDRAEVAGVDAWYWLLDHAEHPSPVVHAPDGSALRGRIDSTNGKHAWVSGAPKAAFLAATPGVQATMLAELADSTRSSVPRQLAAQLYMRPSDWALLAGMGMRVGAHSVRHPRLTQVSAASLREEVAASVLTASGFGSQVSFAYPDGAFDDRVVAEVSRAGVSSAVTCEPGVVLRGADVLRLPRVFVTGAPSPEPATPTHPSMKPAAH